MSRVRIAVAGAGMIGRRHVEEVQKSSSAELAAIVDPAPAGAELGKAAGVPVYPSLADLFAAARPDGVILATPNQMHVQGGLECVGAGVPVVVEKPIGDTVAEPSTWSRRRRRPGSRCSPGTTGSTARSWPKPARSSRAACWGRSSR